MKTSKKSSEGKKAIELSDTQLIRMMSNLSQSDGGYIELQKPSGKFPKASEANWDWSLTI